MRRVEIAGRLCHAAGNQDAATAIYVPMQRDAAKSFAQTVSQLPPEVLAASRICALEVPDWAALLTPWPTDAPAGASYAGNGEETLAWLTGTLMPAFEGREPVTTRYLAGYSLAGLFCLWALTCETAFHGCACVSGSLWYPGMVDYMRTAPLPQACSVYLGLGTREARTKRGPFAGVGEATDAVAALLAGSPRVARTVSERYPGGHFDDPAGRLARGIAWLAGAAQ